MPAKSDLAIHLSLRQEINPDPSDDQQAVTEAVLADVRRCIATAYSAGVQLVITAEHIGLANSKRADNWTNIQIDCMHRIRIQNPKQTVRGWAALLGISAPQMSRLFRGRVPFTVRSLGKLRACVEAGSIICESAILTKLEQTVR